jgi:protein-disulfide isomerase-like protein with CxxC motif
MRVARAKKFALCGWGWGAAPKFSRNLFVFRILHNYVGVLEGTQIAVQRALRAANDKFAIPAAVNCRAA